ncbi:MAG: DNA repair protein RecO [bacterium]
MPVFSTDAIVLKQFDLGEADKIITFYSKDRGKVRAVANNVRKTNSRMSGLVLPFSYNRIKIYRGSSLDKINQVQVKYSFSKLREDLSRMAYATYMAEIVEKVGMEDDSEPQIFSLLLSTFHKMVDLPEKKLGYLNLTFKLRILAVIGFKPELEDCAECGQKINISSRNVFDIALGGLLCEQCSSGGNKDNKINLSGEVYQIIKMVYDSGLKFPKNLQLSRKGFKQLENLLDKFIKYHLDIYLKSQEFLYMIRDLG